MIPTKPLHREQLRARYFAISSPDIDLSATHFRAIFGGGFGDGFFDLGSFINGFFLISIYPSLLWQNICFAGFPDQGRKCNGKELSSDG